MFLCFFYNINPAKMSRRKFNDKDGHEPIYRMFNAGLKR